VAQDEDMLGVLPQTPDQDGRPTAPRKRRSAADAPLSRATESLTRSAALVRRAAADLPPSRELSVALADVEDALGDLSHGMARMASAIDDQDVSSGGLAWRLQTLRHALAAARHLCSHARAVIPHSGVAPSNGAVDDASPA
jgi:hypothetical protein